MESAPRSATEKWISVGTSFLAPATVLTSLLLYYGYASSHARYAFFGVDVNLVGLSTQDYVLNSPQVLVVPALAIVLVTIILVIGHGAVESLWAKSADSRALARTALVVRTLAMALLVLGLVLMFGYPVFRSWPYYDLVTPLLLGSTVGIVTYIHLLLSRIAGTDQPPPRAISGNAGLAARTRPRHGTLIALALAVMALAMFWTTTTVARWSGRGQARQLAQDFGSLPRVILDTKERLWLREPFVQETELPLAPGQSYRYRYRNLRLLIEGGGHLFLVPDHWSPSDSTIVVPFDGSSRVQFQFQNP